MASVRPPQDGTGEFFAVWDHWLLDTLSSWQKQAEGPYQIEMDDERQPSPPSRQQQEQAIDDRRAAVEAERAALQSSAPADAPPIAADDEALPPRKRPRPELGVNGAGPPAGSYVNATA